MLRSSAVALSSLWLFLAPILCAAGVLKHACDCASEHGDCEPCCVGEELGCDCVEDGCSHDSCANDPCQIVIVVEKSSVQCGFASQAALAALEPSPAWLLTPLRPGFAATSGPPGARKNLPRHLSDIPLLL